MIKYGSVARVRRRRRTIAVHYWRHHSADSTLHLSFRSKIFVSLATAFAKTGASDLFNSWYKYQQPATWPRFLAALRTRRAVLKRLPNFLTAIRAWSTCCIDFWRHTTQGFRTGAYFSFEAIIWNYNRSSSGSVIFE